MHINLPINETGLLFPTIHIEQNVLLHRPKHMVSLIVESSGFCVGGWSWGNDVNRKFHAELKNPTFLLQKFLLQQYYYSLESLH